MARIDFEIRHGYTQRDLDKLSLTALRRTGLTWDVEEMTDVAMCAMVEFLWARDAAPAFGELIDVGSDAIRDMNRDEKRHHCMNKWGEQAVNATVYWHDFNRPREPWEERFTDEVSLVQVCDALSVKHRELLWTRACFQTAGEAARSLGMDAGQFSREFRRARDAARVLWFSPDVAPVFRGRDRRSSTVGSRAVYVQRMKRSRNAA